MTLDLAEVEALRLADLEGLYQEQAAERMRISRSTFARIVSTARRKTAEALIHGKALLIADGTVETEEDDMPNRDGTGPAGRGPGRGLGPCGCGSRRGRTGRHGDGVGRGLRCGHHHGDVETADGRRPDPTVPKQEDGES